jgi:hypothetical protein
LGIDTGETSRPADATGGRIEGDHLSRWTVYEKGYEKAMRIEGDGFNEHQTTTVVMAHGQVPSE